MEKTFPNGFESWQETHFEIVSEITLRQYNPNEESRVSVTEDEKGQGGLYQLAMELTDKFEAEYNNESREEDPFFELLEKFLDEELS